MSKVAVIGNTARAIGAVCASDLTLSGHQVRYAVFPEQKDQLPEVRKAGGFTVEYMPRALGLYKETPKIEDGMLVVPQKPGLGLEFDSEIFKRYAQ